ncbi:MAG: hypothetical protein Q4C95_00110 [Planctomycetia bacterium]|nr:hypothetical protein [Planctomycetia bacterium]
MQKTVFRTSFYIVVRLQRIDDLSVAANRLASPMIQISTGLFPFALKQKNDRKIISKTIINYRHTIIQINTKLNIKPKKQLYGLFSKNKHNHIFQIISQNS